MKKDIYEKLFDTMNANLVQSGEASLNSKARIFHYYAENDPGQINILDLSKIEASNDEFVQIAFLAVLNRPIDDTTYQKWQADLDLPQEAFREKVLRRITLSDECANTSKKLYDNIFSDTNQIANIIKQPSLLMRTAVKAYRGMPEPIKNVVRKIRGIN